MSSRIPAGWTKVRRGTTCSLLRAQCEPTVTEAASTPVVGSRSVWRFVPVTLTMPLFAATLGVDGGPIFQILAVENLGLSAAVIGTAFGFGVVSVPIQIAAARIPLHRARRNIQWFLAFAAIQAWLLAALVGAGVTGGLAAVALAVTITAEISVSVLFATAWQPLLSFGVDSAARQRLNSMWPAIARGVLAGALIVFAALAQTPRAVFLAAIGVLAIACAVTLNGVPSPEATPPHEDDRSRTIKPNLPPGLAVVFIVLGVVNFGAVPLWLIYLNDVLWPDANLGLIAATHTIASMVALLAWRPTERDVRSRALIAAVATLTAASAIPFFAVSITTFTGQTMVLAATATMAAGTTIVRVAILEQTHRLVDPTNTVRVFTLLDVVASTTLQAGLVAAGFLITAATNTTSWLLDPYEILIVACSAAAVIAIGTLSLTLPDTR